MYLLFDIGKTKTRMAGSQDLHSFGKPRIFETPREYGEFLALAGKTAEEICGGETIEGAAGGIGEPMERKTGVIRERRHKELRSWEGGHLADDLRKIFHAPVLLENDAALAGLGEAVHGAGREFPIAAYITVSTGVGGARIVNGKIDISAQGFEPGWQILTLAGDTERMYAEEFLGGKFVEKMSGKKPREIVNAHFWDQQAKILARFLNNIVALWSPDGIVLGGSMMNEVGISVPATEKYLAQICKIFPALPPLKHSELGDFGGLFGAMELLKNHPLATMKAI